MTTNGSASTRKQESHAQEPQHSTQVQQTHNATQPQQLQQTGQNRKSLVPESWRKCDNITPDLKRRARRLAVDGRVDHQTRGMIRYALHNRDPYLRQLVTRVEAGEMRIDRLILETDY
jgi:hypothetical protein